MKKKSKKVREVKNRNYHRYKTRRQIQRGGQNDADMVSLLAGPNGPGIFQQVANYGSQNASNFPLFMLASLMIYLGYEFIKKNINYTGSTDPITKKPIKKDVLPMKEVGYDFYNFNITVDDIVNSPWNIIPWFLKIYQSMGVLGFLEFLLTAPFGKTSTFIFGKIQRTFFATLSGFVNVLFEAGSRVVGLFYKTGEKILINPVVKTVDVITDTIIPGTASAIVDRIKYEMAATPPPPPSTIQLIKSTLIEFSIEVGNFMGPLYETILKYAKMITDYAEDGAKQLLSYLPPSITENYSPLTLAVIAIFGSVVIFKVGSKLFSWLRGVSAYIYEYNDLALNNLEELDNILENPSISNDKKISYIIEATENLNRGIKLIKKSSKKMQTIKMYNKRGISIDIPLETVGIKMGEIRDMLFGISESLQRRGVTSKLVRDLKQCRVNLAALTDNHGKFLLSVDRTYNEIENMGSFLS